MPIKNEKGEVVLFLVSHKDITDNKDQDHADESETGERKPGQESEALLPFRYNSHEMIR